MILRPYGIVIEGQLQLGLEAVIDQGTIHEVRPHTGVPEDYVLSPAFVNAHSHLEYRGLQDRIPSQPFWDWALALVSLYRQTSDEEARAWTRLAAAENRQTGVALIAEHSNRPFSGAALASQGIGGTIYQETITFDCWGEAEGKIKEVEERADQHRKDCNLEVYVSAHAPYSVDPASLQSINGMSAKISIHASESPEEHAWVSIGQGPIAEFYKARGWKTPGFRSLVEYLDSLEMLRPGTQLVHCCTVDDQDIERMARTGVSVAHCPASNAYLHCPIAPVRRMLEAGVPVGLGLDSAASGGPIDLFRAMRCALDASLALGEPLSPETVWNMATTAGARSLGRALWAVEPGSKVPLIRIDVPGAGSVMDLIERASPEKVSFVQTLPRPA